MIANSLPRPALTSHPGRSARALPRLLLIEPQDMLRRTVSLTARSLNIAEIQEVTSLAAARPVLMRTPFVAILMADQGDGAALELVREIREQQTACTAETAIGLMVTELPRSVLDELKALSIRSVIIHPAKVKTLLSTVSALIAPADRAVPVESPVG